MKKTIIVINIIIFIIVIFFIPTARAQTPTPSSTTSEERSVYNLNQGLLPKEAIGQEPVGGNIFEALVRGIFNFLVSHLLFLRQPGDPDKVFVESRSIQQAEIPPELKPKQDENPIEQLRKFLGGGSSGVYPVSLPDIPGVNKESIQESEKLFEKSYFPEGINPITR